MIAQFNRHIMTDCSSISTLMTSSPFSDNARIYYLKYESQHVHCVWRYITDYVCVSLCVTVFVCVCVCVKTGPILPVCLKWAGKKNCRTHCEDTRVHVRPHDPSQRPNTHTHTIKHTTFLISQQIYGDWYLFVNNKYV